MNIFKQFIRLTAKLALVLATLSVAAVIFYYSYQTYLEKQALAFSANPDWNCSVLETGYQSCNAGETSFIRTINQENDSQIMLQIAEDSVGQKRYRISLVWNEECAPGSSILTDQEFSDGTKIFLVCAEWLGGTAFIHTYLQNTPPTNISFSFGGFEINEYINTDISWLERQFTLSNVRSSDEIEAERIAAAEASAEKERLASEARLDEERLTAEARAAEERLASEERLERERLLAIEVERQRQIDQCNEDEDSREQALISNFDNAYRNVDVAISCTFDYGPLIGTPCYPDITIKNNSVFTLLSATVGYTYVRNGRQCPQMLVDKTMWVSTSIRANQSLTQKAYSYIAYLPEASKACATLNETNFERPRFERKSCKNIDN